LARLAKTPRYRSYVAIAELATDLWVIDRL
jgi:hypothetical protein